LNKAYEIILILNCFLFASLVTYSSLPNLIQEFGILNTVMGLFVMALLFPYMPSRIGIFVFSHFRKIKKKDVVKIE